ncbi:jg9731, partial [Pararge aegeria aegeria]
FEPIYKVKQQNGAWRTVVQSRDYDFVQRYRLEACTNPGRSCFVGNNPMEIDTSCRQKFTTMDLVVMKGYNDTETISVQLPSQCGCYMSQSVVNS